MWSLSMQPSAHVKRLPSGRRDRNDTAWWLIYGKIFAKNHDSIDIHRPLFFSLPMVKFLGFRAVWVYDKDSWSKFRTQGTTDGLVIYFFVFWILIWMIDFFVLQFWTLDFIYFYIIYVWSIFICCHENTTHRFCGNPRDPQMALGLVEKIMEIRLAPDVITVNAALSSCEKAPGEWLQALRLFHVMPQWKLKRDHISYSSAISCCEKAGQWQQALNLLACYKRWAVENMEWRTQGLGLMASELRMLVLDDEVSWGGCMGLQRSWQVKTLLGTSIFLLRIFIVVEPLKGCQSDVQCSALTHTCLDGAIQRAR